MGELLAFEIGKARWHRRRVASASAEIIIFPGVRYERMEEPRKAPKKPASRPPRRPRPKKERAS